ncbi:hypothetical protein A2631_04970 [Candidatus Daviesbacteria bacterium RIFCSPHIGHO2_01_FULL_44_29]|uniref:Uncharacterized protein n=1 Tax=Candidatus Daviesbacteria bacterium RIFCSPHIGHO2_02_FULL_43_12 TaxID=1797776 RepID=A0A1F5KGW2_9BACT|nr:MAG: hypothetical protein A2631_04970 [Candidatus Daviesbacteria bacterium RIFCSPHIGHO2_01_FULL_44_29]OGE40074.1 MAG: hypothetical protein A3D25_04700 [Candidatus Daviesbacteria bacterium RIFCSPHIGHO2_02_FULL_43_12]OGE41444.1 MAG: hypothetical protein A3E86_05110 [Candidatus Daviesbacteria bacterium RIFCSPHIGHO2_12_FULL_47_45]OGE70246.1 MAG: hypothetical protein A3B55_00870 [Candidatus Daviesbacteria bacterium RIFCSPLOWO2_01_FULL_43_15]
MKKNGQLFEEFITGISANALGTSAEAEKPFPMTDSLPLWYDLFVIKVAEALQKNKLQPELLPTVSNLRFILYKIMRSYVGLSEERKRQVQKPYQKVFNLLLETIRKLVPIDSFCVHSNLYWSQEEVEDRLSQLELSPVQDREESRLIAKLNLGLTSLVHGLYNDIVTDFGIDVYGPYQVAIDGQEYALLVKNFPDLNPLALSWPQQFLPKIKQVYMYLLYAGTKWEIKGVGCHTNLLSGNPIDDLRKVAVVADGEILDQKEIEALTKETLLKSQDLYIHIIDSGFEEQKKQALFQECFQFKKLFDKAGIDWKPSQEMIARVAGKEIIPTPGVIQDMTEYRQKLGVDRFKEEVVL